MRTIVARFATLSIFAFAMANGAAGASGECPITYETFEYAVPHIDSESCPGADRPEGSFCRASVGGNMVHIFYFAENGDHCLLKVKSFDEDEFSLTTKNR